MAQVKKLQGGGTSTPNTQTTPKKRVYNGVELTDVDLDKIVNDTAEFISKNSNYSEDIRGISELSNRLKEELKKGNMPEFDPTGTGVKIGDINISAGKHNQNVFGNFSGDKLGREFAFRLKEGFDSYTKPSEGSQTTVSTTPSEKYHKSLGTSISDRYFGGNWENTQKGIGELTTDKRLAYVKQGLKDSISGYKTSYNEDSKYANRLAEIDAATPERIKEIAYEMGMDATDFLEGSAAQRDGLKPKEEIDTTSSLGKFLQSKGWKYVKDKDGKFKPVQGDNPSDLQEGVIKDFGEFYGYGLFKDSSGELKFGKKKDFEGTDLYGRTNAAYSEIFAGNQNNISKGLNSIDYNNYNNPLFTKLDKYRTNNVFDYYDLSNQFTGIQPNQRLYTPKSGIKFDDLGNIDVDNSELFLYDDSTQKLERINPSMSYNSNILAGKYNLGTIGANPNTLNPLKNVQETYRNTLNQKAPEFDTNNISKAINLLKGWEGAKINSNNALRFLTDAVNNKYASGSLEPHEKQLLANYMSRIFTKYVNRNTIGPQFMSSLQTKIDELLGKPQGTEKLKKGGIIKAQVGAMLTNQKTAPVKITKLSEIGKAPSQSVRLRDAGGSWEDKADMIALGGDALSLTGGVSGIVGGAIATVAQGASDISRHGLLSGTTMSNLGINLGFTLLAAVPGLGLTKGAVKAAKLAKELKTAKTALKTVDGTGDLIKNAEKVVKLAEKAEESKTGKKAFEKLFIKNQAILPKKESLNVATRVLATGGKGFVAGLGVTGALQSIPDIYKDVKEGGIGAIQTGDLRGALGLAGVGKMAYGHLKKQALKGVTNPSSVFKTEPIEVNVKGVEGINKVKIDKYTNAKDLEPQIKSKVNLELDSKIAAIKNQPQTKETAKEIAKLESLKDKATLDMGWWNKQGKHLGNIKNSAKESTSNFWRDRIVNDLSKRTYNPEKINSTKLMDRWGNKLAAENKYLDFSEDIVEQSIKESVKKVKKPRVKKPKVEPKSEIKKMLALPAGKFYNAKQKLGISSNSNNMYEMNGKPKSDIYGQLSMFKQGGQLIPKFALGDVLPTPKKSTFLSTGQFMSTKPDFKLNFPKANFSLLGEKKLDPVTKAVNTTKAKVDSGISNFKLASAIETKKGTDYISGQAIGGKSNYTLIPQKFDTKIPIINNPGQGKGLQDSSQEINQSTNETSFSPYKKRNLNINPGTAMEFGKLADALGTNKRVAQQLRSVSPVLAQMTSEVYKPVVTNLANENFVNNQVSSYLQQASKPMTSDATLQKAVQLEALSKTTPMTIQARAGNTDMYNQTLNASRDSAEKYGAMRTEVANVNRERIGANEARLAQIGATQSAMNKESRAAFTDEMIKNQKEKAIREFGVKNQLELNKLQNEYTGKLKPYSDRYTNFLNDPKTTDAYKRAENWQKFNRDKRIEDYTENGKSYSELLALEQANAQKVYENESEKLRPYYETAMINLRGGDPYSRSYSFGTYKQGGSIDVKVEIQNLKNKMKAKEINTKSSDKAKDRDQKAVAAILKSMSKESLFLLKTMLGK